MTKISRRTALAGLAALAGCSRQDAVKAVERERPKIRSDLYQCEGCEAALEQNPASLQSSAVIASTDEPGERMRIQGVVYKTDGSTPAPDVVIYAYQTNSQGFYAGGTPGTEASLLHGRLRAWAKTDSAGRYSFETIKPAPYPNETLAAHVHLTILEQGRRPYWIDDIVFDDEFGVTPEYRKSMTNKGGNGIIKLGRDSNGTWIARRDIVLEHHPE